MLCYPVLQLGEKDIVFEHVGPGNVVVVRVLISPDDSCGLIHGAIDRLEGDTDPPFRMPIESRMASGNLPAVASRETCASTYCGLGADSSRTISHRGGSQSWVIATVQPAGSLPGGRLTNRITSDEVAKYSRTAAPNYRTINGRRTEKKRTNTKVASNARHTLRVDFQDNHFTVTFDGKKGIEWDDNTFKDAGKVGVWTKADSVTLFDDFSCGAK